MKTFIKPIFRGMLLSTAVWATACSDVAFTPDPNFNQGLEAPPGGILETFGFSDQDTRAKVDILFVVDNSRSMLDEQMKLAPALNSFLSMIAKIDWQIGFTTTDVSDGQHGVKGSLLPLKGASGKILTAATPNYAQVFANTVVRDELVNCKDTDCPSADERPLEAITLAISKRNGDNAGFFRDGADLATIILSDEDERSTGSGTSATDVVNTVKSAFGVNKTFTAFGIVIKPGDSTCYNRQQANGGNYGTYASALALLTQGLTGSICDDDYGPTLASIGNRVREAVKSITLKVMPNPSTIQLKMIPFDPNLQWTVEGQTITFSYPPKAGTKIWVAYLPF